jgi:hypothetical protein
MMVFPLRRSVGLRAATASSRVATLPIRGYSFLRVVQAPPEVFALLRCHVPDRLDLGRHRWAYLLDRLFGAAEDAAHQHIGGADTDSWVCCVEAGLVGSENFVGEFLGAAGCCPPRREPTDSVGGGLSCMRQREP